MLECLTMNRQERNVALGGAAKWSFTVTFSDTHDFPHWSVTSPHLYDSKGEALYHAYAACQKRGFTPQARGITISTSKK